MGHATSRVWNEGNIVPWRASCCVHSRPASAAAQSRADCSPLRTLALVAKGGLRLIAVGIAFGLAGSALVTRVLQLRAAAVDPIAAARRLIDPEVPLAVGDQFRRVVAHAFLEDRGHLVDHGRI